MFGYLAAIIWLSIIEVKWTHSAADFYLICLQFMARLHLSTYDVSSVYVYLLSSQPIDEKLGKL